MSKQINFNDYKTQLTENDIDQIVAIVGYHCRLKTLQRLRSVLTYHPSSVGHFGILGRLIKEGDKWGYVAGQSYPDEIRTVRECILGKIY